MRYLAPVLANVFLLVSAFGLGSLFRSFLPASFSKADRLAAIPLIGIGFQGLLLFLVGLIRFTPPLLALFLGPGAILGVLALKRECFPLRQVFKLTRFPAIPVAVVGFVLAITIAGGFSEPFGNMKTNDSIAYHYLGPKVWLRQGVVRPVFDQSLTAFPATVEVQYAALFALGGPSGPAFFSVTAFFLMLLVVAAISLRCGLDSIQVWWVLALVSAMPAVYRGLYDAMIDVIYACFLLMAARVAFDAFSKREFLLAGLFCGFAMGTKYTGLIASPLICFCALLHPADVSGRSPLARLKLLGPGSLVAVLVAAPWYIRNWLVLGCPLYPPPPALLRFFPVHYLPLEAVANINHLMLKVGNGLGKDLPHLLLLPFNLAFHPAGFEAGAGGIGLVPLALLPFSFRARYWDRFAKGLALLGFLMTLAWFYTAQESRYLIQVYLIAAIFGVAGWRFVAEQTPRVTRVLSGLTVAVSILYGLFMIVAGRVDDVRSGLSSTYTERRRQTEIPFVESFRYLNENASVSKVLLLDPLVPAYYLNKEYLKPFGKYGERAVPEVQSTSDALADPRKFGVTHVLDVQWEDGDFKVLPYQKNLVLVFEANGQKIYRVIAPD